MDWRTLKKIDSHIHIIPDVVHAANPEAEDVWVYANLHSYAAIMEQYHIEQAVIMPLNDPFLMSMEFTISDVHRNLYEMKQRYPGKFFAFGDVDGRNSPENSVSAICQAIEVYDLDGIKLHPNNSGIALDSDYNRELFSFAEKQRIPVALHSYPNAEDDLCAPSRIVKILDAFPDLMVIVSHMGAYQWQTLLPTNVLVDISAILPDYVRAYGLSQTNEILRNFGSDRLLFATDYPDSRFLQPGQIYESYFDILNQMDFTREEAEKIAYHNIANILK